MAHNLTKSHLKGGPRKSQVNFFIQRIYVIVTVYYKINQFVMLHLNHSVMYYYSPIIPQKKCSGRRQH